MSELQYGNSNLLQVLCCEIRGTYSLLEFSSCSAHESVYADSFALTEHLWSRDQMTKYSRESLNGNAISMPREALNQALDASREPQHPTMFRAQLPSSARAAFAPTSA
ncbi:MAG: hypothetical protein EON56_00045 [Alphaproteobacteria bacterium]|nr:MAG: hypothetical protein EON56_00045 [Alphaproteobacteria bacterium]